MSSFQGGGRVPEPRRSVDVQSCLLVCEPPYGFPQSVLVLLGPSQQEEREVGRREDGSVGASLLAHLLCSSFMLHRSQSQERQIHKDKNTPEVCVQQI